MPATLWITLFFAMASAAIAVPPVPLQKFENCTLVPTDWADGDSFRVKTAAGNQHTLRLYGIDCLEWHVTSDTDARRLRAQRRYFGITEAAPTPQESIELAKNFGKQAAEKTAVMLKQPFTVHTRFRDALGDSKYKRIYAVVTCADGADLASTLVKSGLARAFGVGSDNPDGSTAADFTAMLADLEIQAAKRGAGIWARTDWEKLPAQRRDQRVEDGEIQLATAKQPVSQNFKLDPNTATDEELMKLPGIGEAMARRIIAKRPFKQLADLNNVEGIGPKSLEKLSPHLVLAKP